MTVLWISIAYGACILVCAAMLRFASPSESQKRFWIILAVIATVIFIGFILWPGALSG